MKKVLILGFIIILVSCNTVNIEVENHSGSKVDSVIVSNGFDNWKHGTIQANEQLEGELVFSGTIKTDGGYQVKILRNDKYEYYGFGYYTNGSPTSNKMIVKIEKDSVVAYELPDKY
jgi:hypothetical protein